MYSRLCFHGARPGLVMGGSSELFQCIRARHNLHFILLTKNSQPSFWLCLAKAHQAPLCTADKFPAMWRQDRVSQHQWGTSAGPRETLSLCVFAIMWAEYLGWQWGRGPMEAEGRVGGIERERERERGREGENECFGSSAVFWAFWNACAIIAMLCLPQQEANTESQRRGAETPDTVKWAKYIH